MCKAGGTSAGRQEGGGQGARRPRLLGQRRQARQGGDRSDDPGGVARPVPRAPRPDRAVAQDRRHLSLLRRGAWSRRDLPQDGTHRRGLGPRPVLRAARRGRQVARGRRQGPHAPVGCAPPGGQVGDGLSALRWSGVDFDTAMLTVARSIVDRPGHVAEGPTKTHRVRIMALAPAAVALLRPAARGGRAGRRGCRLHPALTATSSCSTRSTGRSSSKLSKVFADVVDEHGMKGVVPSHPPRAAPLRRNAAGSVRVGGRPNDRRPPRPRRLPRHLEDLCGLVRGCRQGCDPSPWSGADRRLNAFRAPEVGDGHRQAAADRPATWCFVGPFAHSPGGRDGRSQCDEVQPSKHGSSDKLLTFGRSRTQPVRQLSPSPESVHSASRGPSTGNRAGRPHAVLRDTAKDAAGTVLLVTTTRRVADATSPPAAPWARAVSDPGQEPTAGGTTRAEGRHALRRSRPLPHRTHSSDLGRRATPGRSVEDHSHRPCRP